MFLCYFIHEHIYDMSLFSEVLNRSLTWFESINLQERIMTWDFYILTIYPRHILGLSLNTHKYFSLRQRKSNPKEILALVV